ncbi:hypothetical protein DAY46_22715 [Salmonella enterica subsp. enterica serovar Enteritidis]|nr:hypothetical protein [Salmonella enterica subsp. enterica serovar Enteritidis]
MAYPPFCTFNHPTNDGIKLHEAYRTNVTQLYLPLRNKSVYNQEVKIRTILFCNVHGQVQAQPRLPVPPS